jgi:hypothetical protein
VTVLALLNQYFLLNAVDLSDHIRGATLAVNAAQLNSEAMGDSWEEVTTGLKAGTINFEVLDDFALSSIDATIWAAFNAGTNVAWEMRPVNASRSTTNPGYTGSIHPSEYKLGGSINTMAMKSLTWKLSGAVTRNTS